MINVDRQFQDRFRFQYLHSSIVVFLSNEYL